MDSLRDALDDVERRRKTLVVHTDDGAVAEELRYQFETRNVGVTHRSLGSIDDAGFVIVRDDGDFQGALGLDQFRAILSPERHPPWELAEGGRGHATLFDFLENTLFSSYSREQMVATSREIEERAWRVGSGRLYAGFQQSAALRAQAGVYDRFGERESIAVAVFLGDECEVALDDSVAVVTDGDGELGAFWFVAFEGDESGLSNGALLAEERDPGHYYGFWTFDPSTVGELIAYLEQTYDVP